MAMYFWSASRKPEYLVYRTLVLASTILSSRLVIYAVEFVSELRCQICFELRILLSKVTNEVSNLAIVFASDVDRIRVPTVDDQPYSDARSLN